MREGYKKLDKSKLNNRINKTISTKEALSQVTPLEFIEDVYNGTKKVQIDKRGIHYKFNELMEYIENSDFELLEIVDNI